MMKHIRKAFRSPEGFGQCLIYGNIVIRDNLGSLKSKLVGQYISIKRGISNLVYWFPVIWRDRWFDFDFLFRILERKLLQMANGMLNEGVSLDSEKTSKELFRCAEICRNFIEDNHLQKEEDELFENYPLGWLESGVEDDGFVSKQLVCSTEQRDAHLKLLKQKDLVQKKELLELFDKMRTKILSWWD